MNDNPTPETNLGIDGFGVTSVKADFGLHLELARDTLANLNRARIAIESPLGLRLSDSDVSRMIDPQSEDRTVLDPVLAAAGRLVEQETVGADGILTVRFSGGLTITVRPSPQYEAWNVNVEFGRWFTPRPPVASKCWATHRARRRRTIAFGLSASRWEVPAASRRCSFR